MIDGLLTIGGKLIDKLLPDQEAKQKAKVHLLEMAQNGELEMIRQQSETIRAEMEGESWLQRNWRPLTMVVFAGLVVAHWLGFTAENLSEGQVMALLDIVKIGLGGYVLGRSGEKIMKEYRKK